jgi:uncharacterized protein YbjQ (UPF0145 family)
MIELEPKLQQKLKRAGAWPADKVFECTWKGAAAVAAFAGENLAIVGIGFGREMGGPSRVARLVERNGAECRVQCYGIDAILVFADKDQANRFESELSTHRRLTDQRPTTTISPERVTTLAQLPGYHTVRVLGAITELSATSGFTASMKGNAALDEAMQNLRATATVRGANAIVGLAASVFGAKGGVTSAFGGDAVGVLLMGTAVVVEPADAGGDQLPRGQGRPTASYGEG